MTERIEKCLERFHDICGPSGQGQKGVLGNKEAGVCYGDSLVICSCHHALRVYFIMISSPPRAAGNGECYLLP